MSEYTRPATWDDLKLLARYLAEAGADYALIGGYAVAAHGYNRFSEDIDLLVDPSPENTKRWVKALARLPDAASLELEGEPDIFQRLGHYAIRINDEFTVDVMPAACGHDWDELRAHIATVDIDDVPVKVLTLEGLLLTKEGLREKDQADARVIRAALEKLKERTP